MRFKLFSKSKKSHVNQADSPRSSASSLQEAETWDVLSPLKAACKATQTIIGVVQGIKNNQEDWSEIIQRLQDYLSAIEEQITLLKRENTSRPLDEAFCRPLARYVKIVDRTERQRSKSLGGFAEISTIKIDAGDIQRFNRDIEAQHRQFMDALNVYTANRVQVIQHDTKTIKETMLTEADYNTILQMPMVASAASSVHNACLKGTRQAVLQEIGHWAREETSETPTFWLCDIAGSGKSTVAMSAIEHWNAEGILGGTFFFSMSNSESSTTDKLCSTIARDLAQHLPELGSYIAKAWKQNPSIQRSSFNEHPLQYQQKRVILVVDAMDECKSRQQRQELVETLAAAARESKNFQIIITSSPDHVIEKVSQPLSIKFKLTDRLHDTIHHDNIDDIATDVHQSLDGLLTHDERRRLVNKANGLFIWASTACRMLDDESSPVKLKVVYDRLMSIDQPGAIDGVYDLVLERIDERFKLIVEGSPFDS
ncbi:SubName: Full=Related to archipelago beta form (F-box-WD40 repeat protein) {ECO:0000313/EMBL:CCA76170.1} [Serendipita indica DSM 11827]|nr:SubName: Full=Related to archipelago beta form (F-box-WD40 repeat protein) {ECO:0000313/EMBL:CCA76170.1} [Serendipita indica DSM 11827]